MLSFLNDSSKKNYKGWIILETSITSARVKEYPTMKFFSFKWVSNVAKQVLKDDKAWLKNLGSDSSFPKMSKVNFNGLIVELI